MAVTAARLRVPFAAVLFATIIAIIVSIAPNPAYAADDEGCVNAALCAKLEDAAIKYYDIQAKLTASQKRQAEIQKKLQDSELTLLRLRGEVSNIAAARYKGGQLGIISQFLLGGHGDTADILRGGAVAEYLTQRDDKELREFRIARDEADNQRALLAAEVANEKTQLKELDKQLRSAEKALAAIGGIVSAGYSGPPAPVAQPAQRNADGSFPRESCSLPDPTGGKCVSPRMVHVINQVKFAGFNRKAIGCWRWQTWGEHPLGRACDFMVTSGGAIATGANKTYGSQLAAWAIKNSDALGIMYVIWFRQIWTPGIGWRSYVGPSPHVDHVHISVI